MRQRLVLVATATAVLVGTILATSRQPARPATAVHPKKIIEMGWDEPDPAFLRAHAAEMDTMPFDGCVFHVPFRTAEGRTGNFAWEAWGPTAFRAADLDSAQRDLTRAHFTHMRSNFVRMNVTPGTVGWFDDPTSYLSNYRIAARFAKDGGAAGILFDTEPYGRPIFRYRDQPNPRHLGYAAFASQARLRGGQVMRAMEEGDPGLTVFLTCGATQGVIESLWARAALDTTPYGLLAPFVDGMISAASDSARIVDGLEASYPVRRPGDLDRYVDLERRLVLPWITDPARYRRIVSLSFGLWIDHDWTHRGWDTKAPERNYRSPGALDSTLTRALQLCDEYVWLYGEKPSWWTKAGGRANLPDAYVEAVRRARRAVGI